MSPSAIQAERDELLSYMTRRFGDTTGRTFTGRDKRDIDQMREHVNELSLRIGDQRREIARQYREEESQRYKSAV